MEPALHGCLCRLHKVKHNPADKLAYNTAPAWKRASGQSTGDQKTDLMDYLIQRCSCQNKRLIQSKNPLCDDASPQRRTERAENNTNTTTCQLNFTVNIITPSQREIWRRQATDLKCSAENILELRVQMHVNTTALTHWLHDTTSPRVIVVKWHVCTL